MKRTTIPASSIPLSTAPPLRAGYYFFPYSPSSTNTSSGLGNGTLRLGQIHLPRPVTIDRIGAEITVVGDVGSKLRLVVYNNHASYMWPGDLLLDAGQIAGDSATTQELTVSLALAAGTYWLGGAVQSAATTQPTVRVGTGATPFMPASTTPTLPTSNWLASGFSTTGVPGAAPSSFPSTATSVSTVPRVFMRAV